MLSVFKRGGANEPYCSDQCCSKGGNAIFEVTVGRQHGRSGKCVCCGGPAVTGEAMALPRRGMIVLYCQSCIDSRKAQEAIATIKECAWCGTSFEHTCNRPPEEADQNGCVKECNSVTRGKKAESSEIDFGPILAVPIVSGIGALIMLISGAGIWWVISFGLILAVMGIFSAYMQFAINRETARWESSKLHEPPRTWQQLKGNDVNNKASSIGVARPGTFSAVLIKWPAGVLRPLEQTIKGTLTCRVCDGCTPFAFDGTIGQLTCTSCSCQYQLFTSDETVDTCPALFVIASFFSHPRNVVPQLPDLDVSDIVET